ncbi:MAG TPA: helix-turn-helix domain-containing protein [Desulfatiglandales bacterium]|nr:helix-turn-helix domain-containing protein [Desulfatiglandales bacterium]
MQKQYLTEREVSKLTGRALSTLRNDRQNGVGFPYVKWGRFVRYRKQDVIEFMEARKVIPENEGPKNE